jgi:GH24 family phage-related lysozyme (muramidase)
MKKIVYESYVDYHDSYYEELLFENLNEGVSLDSLKSIVSKIKNPSRTFQNLIGKFNRSKGQGRRGIAALLILLAISSGGNPTFNLKNFSPKIDKLSSIPQIEDNITPQDLMAKYLNDPKRNYMVKIKQFKTSEDALKIIKKHESLRLTAYALGDKMVTIGWGHAERANNTKMIPGITTITKEEAESFFRQDIKVKENGVKRMLADWSKEGLDPNDISQGMFDSMVSMSYNMGNRGLANTNFIAQLKNTGLENEGDILKAANKIKTTKISERFPGLKRRRQDEYNLFVKDMDLS